MTSKLCEKKVAGNGEYLLPSNDDQTLLNEAGRSGCSEKNAQMSGVNARDLQLLQDIALLLEEYMGDGQQSPEENEFPILIENVGDMIDKFRACPRAADSFVAAFPSWMKIRSSNIEKLKEFAKCLDTHHFNCNVSRLTASSVGIVGGIVSIVGAALIPFTLGVSSPLLIGGSAVAATGGATNVGTAIAERVLMKNLFKDAKDLLKKDKEASRCFEEWFQHCSQFLESVGKIADFDIVGHLLEGVQKLQESMSVNDKAVSVLMKNGFENAKDLIKKNKDTARRLKKWFGHFTQFLKLVDKNVGFFVHLLDVQKLQEYMSVNDKAVSVLMKNGVCLEERLRCIPQFLKSVDKIVDFFVYLLEGVQKLEESMSLNDENAALNYDVVVKFAVNLCAKYSIPVAQIIGVVFVVVALCRIPHLLRLMRDFHRSNPLLYETIVFTMNIALQFARATDVGADTATTVLSVVRGGSAVSRPLAATLTKGVLGGLGVALDVASVVLTSIDVHNGSKSEHAKKIWEVIKVLESEMTTLNQLNKELQNVTGKNE